MIYHVSFEEIEEFTPQVPQQRIDGEDNITKRICFAKSIRGALTAMPESYYALKGMMKLKKIPPLIHVYSVDESKVEFKDTVDIEQYVFDAKYTGECWVLNTITKDDYVHKIYCIEDYNFSKEVISDNTYINILEMLKIRRASYEEVHKYMEVWDDINSKLEGNIIPKRTIYSFIGTDYSAQSKTGRFLLSRISTRGWLVV